MGRSVVRKQNPEDLEMNQIVSLLLFFLLINYV